MLNNIIELEAKASNFEFCWWATNCVEEILGQNRMNGFVAMVTNGEHCTVNELYGRPALLALTEKTMQSLSSLEEEKLNDLFQVRAKEVIRLFPELWMYDQ